MSIRAKGLVFAMESDGVDEMEEGSIDGDAAEVEEGSGELQADVTESEDLSDGIADATDDAGTLEQIGGVMQDKVDSGEGISEDAAEIAEIAVEAICNRLGIRNKRALPALESFGSASSRVTATRIAAESIGEYASKAWEAIKKAFFAMWDGIKRIFDKLYELVFSLEKYHARLSEAVKNFDDSKPGTKKEFEDEGLFKALNAGGYETNAKSTTTILESSVKAINSLSEFNSKYEGSLKEWDAKYKAAVTAGWTEFKQKAEQKSTFAEDLSKSFAQISNKGLFGPFVGNEYFSYSKQSNKDELVFSSGSTSTTTGFKVKTLNKGEMESILTESKKTIDALVAFKKLTSGDKIKSGFSKLFDTAIKASGGEKTEKVDEKDKVAALVEARNKIAEEGRIHGNLFRQIPVLSQQGVQKSFSYIRTSMREYGANVPEEKK